MLFLSLSLVKVLLLFDRITCVYTYMSVKARMTTSLTEFLNVLRNESASKLWMSVLSSWGQGQKYDEPWINQSRSGLDKPLHNVMITAFSEQHLCNCFSKQTQIWWCCADCNCTPQLIKFQWNLNSTSCNLLQLFTYSITFQKVFPNVTGNKQWHFIYSDRALIR